MSVARSVAVARLCFDGLLLHRGFWLYVWRIRQGDRFLVYVGRTGDSASPFAASPFIRAGQHLDLREKAKANALVRQLRAHGVDPTRAEYELIAMGPLAPEATERASHWPLRDKVAALEAALAKELETRGYDLIGSHGSRKLLDRELFDRVLAAVEDEFPPLT
jgi:hypothetical protein